MPQVDLETLVSACAGGSCSDRKIACETLSGDDNTNSNSNNHNLHSVDDGDSDQHRPEVPPDFPPESFWLSKDAELDWFDRNAFFERKDSSKGTNSISSSSSQRFSLNLKSKTSIIGLPKLQKSCFVDSKSRRSCKPGNVRLFAKRSGSVSKSDASANEPSSPKVSCMGRVRSKKDRNRKPINQETSTKPETEKPKPAGTRKTGFFAVFRAIFWNRREKIPEIKADAPSQSATIDIHDIRNRLPAGDIDAPPRMSVTGGEPPSLGSMQRFTSGRRSGSWGVGELDAELAKAESSDRDTMRRR